MPIVVFIRHGETNYNKDGKFTGQAEAHLTEKGIEEALNKSKELDKNFDYIYRSPLIRTEETLQAIIPGAKAIIDERITETDLGEWEGKEKDKLDQELVKKFRAGEFVPPKGETREHVFDRVNSFVKDLFDKYKSNERIFVVTHAGIIKALNTIFFDLENQKIENLQILVIDDKVYNNFLEKEERNEYSY